MLIDTFSQFIETIKMRNIHYLLHSQYRDQLFIQALHQNENEKNISLLILSFHKQQIQLCWLIHC